MAAAKKPRVRKSTKKSASGAKGRSSAFAGLELPPTLRAYQQQDRGRVRITLAADVVVKADESMRVEIA